MPLRPEIYIQKRADITNETLEAFQKAHKVYQNTIIEHVVLHRAYERGLFATAPAVRSAYDKKLQEIAARGGLMDSPQVMVELYGSLLELPSRHFPELASDVRKEATEVDVSHLLSKMDPDKNAKHFKHLSAQAKGELSRLADQPDIIDSMKYDLLHEREFKQYNDKPHHLARRIDRWIGKGTAEKPQTRTVRILAIGAAALSGFGGALGYAVGELVQRSESGLSVALRGAARQIFKLAGKTQEQADQTFAKIEKYFEDFAVSAKGKAFTYGLSIATLGLVYSAISVYAPLAGELINTESESFLKDIPYLMSFFKDAATKDMSAGFSMLITTAAGSFFSTLKNQAKDKFYFEAAGSFFKDNPVNLSDPYIGSTSIARPPYSSSASTPYVGPIKDAGPPFVPVELINAEGFAPGADDHKPQQHEPPVSSTTKQAEKSVAAAEEGLHWSASSTSMER